MEKNQAIEMAKKEAKSNRMIIAVVSAPLELEEQDGDGNPFGYGPTQGIETLYSFGVVIGYAGADGSYTACKPKPINATRYNGLSAATKARFLL